MAWDPAVLRKYNTTGHFKLLSQLRSELKDNPLVRPRQGETVGDANRSKALTRLLVGRTGATSRSRRGGAPQSAPAAAPAQEDGSAAGFLDRLDNVQLR